MRPHRQSPATVLSALALFFALGGTAFAGSEFARHYLITSTSQIKPSVLKQLQRRAGVSGAAGAAGTAGSQGPAGSPGPAGIAGSPGAQGSPATALWAVVSAAKKLIASSGVTGFVAGSGVPAVDELVFNQNVSQCAKIATPSSALYERGAEPAEISITAAGNGNPDAIEIFTYEASGASIYRSFSVAVFC
jgi:hypothetical protein